MKYFITTLIIVLFSFQLLGQNQSEAYSRVKIDLRYTSISEVAKLGLETDHGNYAKGKHLVNDFSKREIEKLREHNIPFEILIEDVKAHYVNQNHEGHHHHHDNAEIRGLGDCGVSSVQQYNYVTPTNYQNGSMGGYLTYDELLATLDEMVALYPNLISAKEPVGNITTHEGRPIYWLRLSDNPNVEEDEPEVFYNALHHAREPNSLSQMIFYIWYLLENYETNDEVKYLVDNTEMYFMPCVNPDGYVHNQLIDPNGGGLWRKNRWVDNNGNTYGVDLNRNYDYEWGFDDQGSSPNPDNDTFRGTAGFSEPETQAVRDFCNEHQFQITLNYHAYGNLLIYPWGYSDQPTSDQSTFTAFSKVMTRENNYFAGTGTETVGYTVNGDSDDWMYGESTSKPPIFSLTPEVGDNDFGFWPPANQIDRLNKSALLQNLTAAHLLLNYGEAEEINPESILTDVEGSLEMKMKKYGLLEGELSLTVSAIGNNVTVNNNTNASTLVHLEEINTLIDYTISNDAISGEEILFLVEVDNGEFVWSDTLKKTFIDGVFEIVTTDDGTNTTAWQMNGNWSTTDIDFVSSPVSYTDSPNGNYGGNINSTMNLQEPIDLENAEQAFLNFYTKWDIEAGYDFAQVMASTDNINFTPLCGKYTKTGNGNQDAGEPIYDGGQSEWVLEEINLSDFLGEKIWLRFRIVSDGFVEGDGFYFDDLSVKAIVANATSLETTQLVNEFRVFPNPFEEALYVNVDFSQPTEDLKLRLVNALGQVIYEESQQNISKGENQFIISEKNLTEGIYFLQLLVNEIKLDTRRVIKLK